MYLGIDLGTSGIKVLLLSEAGVSLASGSAPLTFQSPRPSWSEQDPHSYFPALQAALLDLRRGLSGAPLRVHGIGLSGQMHGAICLDENLNVLRPTILWNDGRSAQECEELERRVPSARQITGNAIMPGFTAPKLLWLRKNEPEVFRRTRYVLLPKDYLRLLLTGVMATDMSDASGTMWLDVKQRRWSSAMLDATDLGEASMPELYEGPEITGVLKREAAVQLGLQEGIRVVAGAGDNAAGAIGAGVYDKGSAFISLGTSGVYFLADDVYRSQPEGGVHSFCHCLPQRFHQMSVTLSAASCLKWLSGVLGATEGQLLFECSQQKRSSDTVLFLPYLSGERTPHNDPSARGVFFGLGHATSRADLTWAVLEGVSFALRDAEDALQSAGGVASEVSLLGGGSRSELWGEILATVLRRPLTLRENSATGPALGAARLARLGLHGGELSEVCTPPETSRVIVPDPSLVDRYESRLQLYRTLYTSLKTSFSDGLRLDPLD